LHELAKTIKGDKDSRLGSLVNVVSNHLKKGDKVVVFTEFRDTAEYVFEELKRRLPEAADSVALITSKEIVPPATTGRPAKRYDVEDVKKWLKSGDVQVLISTDVASEGLNLQATACS